MKLKSCWLNNFNLESIQANFNHSGSRIHKKKIVTKKVVSTGKNRKFDVSKTEAEHANNARNRDAFAVTKANNILTYSIEGTANSNKSSNLSEVEDTLITLLDLSDVVGKVIKR
jgi:hypothetical protein